MAPLNNVENAIRGVPNIASHSVYHISLSGKSGAAKSEEILTLQSYNVAYNSENHPASH